MILTTTVSLTLVFSILIIVWLKRKYLFWKERGISTPPYKLGWGHMEAPVLQRASFSDTLYEYYRFFKSQGVKHGGIYSFICPVYIPMDLDIIKSILVNDFEHFTTRGFYRNETDDPLTATFFSLNEEMGKWLKPKFSSAFSPTKLKTYHDNIVKFAEEFVDKLGAGDKNVINVMELSDAYTVDIIGCCAFGIRCNCLKDTKNEYMVNSRAVFRRSLWENIKVQLTEMAPDQMKNLHTRISKRSVIEFFENFFQEAMDYREKNHIRMNDSLDVLVRLRNKEEQDNDPNANEISFSEIVGLGYSVILGSFEATSKNICFTLYLLSINKEIQDKVRQEINKVMADHDGKLTYGSMTDFVYLDMVINESLRLYPPVHHLYRMCTKDYRVPGTDLLLKKGQKVFIPVLGIQRDEEYYPDPEKFDPDRFSAENAESRNSTTFMPFGLGPKYCLAPRFGLMQVKIILIVLLQKFEISLNDKTKSPVELDIGNHILLSPKDGIWLNLKRM